MRVLGKLEDMPEVKALHEKKERLVNESFNEHMRLISAQDAIKKELKHLRDTMIADAKRNWSEMVASLKRSGHLPDDFHIGGNASLYIDSQTWEIKVTESDEDVVRAATSELLRSFEDKRPPQH